MFSKKVNLTAYQHWKFPRKFFPINGGKNGFCGFVFNLFYLILLFKTVNKILLFSIYTLSDLGVLSNLIGSLSLANEHYSPPTE